MEVKVLRSIYEFKDLERPWNNLYDKMNSRAVFQSFDFNYYSWLCELNNNRNALALASHLLEGFENLKRQPNN